MIVTDSLCTLQNLQSYEPLKHGDLQFLLKTSEPGTGERVQQLGVLAVWGEVIHSFNLTEVD